MVSGQLRNVLRHLRRLTGGPDAGVPDAELLRRFVATRDEAAFELLLWRHGPMVHGVCRRVLRHAHDAEDAFQATFLALARKAGSISQSESLGGWLFRVAYRVALRARRPETSSLEDEPAAPEAATDLVWRDLRPVLDQEINRLPRKYSEAIIFCYFQGKTHEQAARELGCTKGALGVRLMRARELLRGRLTRRGLALPAVVFAATLTNNLAPAAVPASLIGKTLACAASGTAAAVSVPVAGLTEGVLRSMLFAKMKATAAGLVLAVCVLGTGTGVYFSSARQSVAGDKDGKEEPQTTLVKVPSERAGKLMFIGTEIRPDEKVPPEQTVEATVGFLAVELARDESENEPTFTIDKSGKKYRRWTPDDPLTPEKLKFITEKKHFRKLKLGDEVKEGQLLALVNPELAIQDVGIKLAKLESSIADLRAATQIKEEAENRCNAMFEAIRLSPRMYSQDEARGARLTRDRYIEEEKAKQAAVRVAEQELLTVLTILKMHEIRSPSHGVLKVIDKKPGEAVRELETVLQIEVEAKPSAKPEKRPNRYNVPSERDGKLLFIGTEIKPDEKVPPEQTVEATVVRLVLHVPQEYEEGKEYGKESGYTLERDGKLYRYWKPGDNVVPGMVRVVREKKRFRKLKIGDEIKEGQLLALVNPELAIHDVEIKLAKLESRMADLRASIKTKDEAENRYQAMLDTISKNRNAFSQDEVRGSRLTRDRYIEEEKAKAAAVFVAEQELRSALMTLKMHEIRSMSRGVLKVIEKKQGEAVRELETVLQIQIVDKDRDD
jgi:RNA polymerase sigma factor (sigma-70 family)